MIAALIRFWKLLDRGDHLRICVALVLAVLGAVFETIGVGLLPLLVAVLSAPQLVRDKLASHTGWHGLDHWDSSRIVVVTMTVISLFFILKNLF